MRAIGIIAEDDSDVEVISILAKKIARKPFKVQSVVGHGCGRIRAKSLAWARNLYARGCRVLLLVHDLDEKKLENLQTSLADALRECPFQASLILIPIKEIEAWLLADHDAINTSLRLKNKIAMVTNPEAVNDAKSRLSDLIRKGSAQKIIYLNTVHNKKIAAACSLKNLRRCTSFRPLEKFLIDQNA